MQGDGRDGALLEGEAPVLPPAYENNSTHEDSNRLL